MLQDNGCAAKTSCSFPCREKPPPSPSAHAIKLLSRRIVGLAPQFVLYETLSFPFVGSSFWEKEPPLCALSLRLRRDLNPTTICDVATYILPRILYVAKNGGPNVRTERETFPDNLFCWSASSLCRLPFLPGQSQA